VRACCFTGHRPEKCGFRYESGCGEFVLLCDELEERLREALDSGIDTFYCGGAKGFDLLAAEKLLTFRADKKFRLIVVIPFEGQADSFSPEWRARYDYVLAAADERICLSDEYFRGCYNRRNRYMVDHSELVIAHYDGSPGGTRDTVKYAEGKGIRVINVGERLKNLFNFSIFD